MAQQTTYTDNPAAAVAGMVVKKGAEVILTKMAEAAVGIGLLAAPGATSMSVPSTSAPITASSGDTGTCKQLPTGTSDDPILDSEFIGIPLWDPASMASDQLSTASQGNFTYSTYKQFQDVALLRKGYIWVFSAQATTQFGDVYVYGTTQTNNPNGQFGFGAGTGKIKFTHGRWMMTTSAAGLSLLEVW